MIICQVWKLPSKRNSNYVRVSNTSVTYIVSEDNLTKVRILDPNRFVKFFEYNHFFYFSIP